MCKSGLDTAAFLKFGVFSASWIQLGTGVRGFYCSNILVSLATLSVPGFNLFFFKLQHNRNVFYPFIINTASHNDFIHFNTIVGQNAFLQMMDSA